MNQWMMRTELFDWVGRPQSPSCPPSSLPIFLFFFSLLFRKGSMDRWDASIFGFRMNDCFLVGLCVGTDSQTVHWKETRRWRWKFLSFFFCRPSIHSSPTPQWTNEKKKEKETKAKTRMTQWNHRSVTGVEMSALNLRYATFSGLCARHAAHTDLIHSNASSASSVPHTRLWVTPRRSAHDITEG